MADEAFWTTDGPVFAAVETNGIVYLGGAFTQVGPATGSFAPIHPVSGQVDRLFARIHGTTATAIADGRGGWFVAGEFSRVGDFQRTNLVHLLADGSVDGAWQVALNGLPRALALAGDTLLVGGDFTMVNEQPRSFLAAVDARTAQLLPLAVTVNAPVLAVAVSGNHAFVGGNFGSVGGLERRRLAKIDITTGAVAGWNPGAADALYDRGVFLMSVLADRLYVGGDFTQIDGVARNGIAAYSLDTETLLPWRPTPSSFGGVRALAVMSNTVYLAGSFAQMNGQPRIALAAVDLVDGLTLPWTANTVTDSAYAIAATNGTVYAGGAFTGIAGGGPARLAAIDSVTGAPKAWNPAPGGTVRIIALGSNAVCVGGDFSLIGGTSRGGLAAIDVNTKRVTPWNPGIGGVEGGSRVHALALAGDALFVGGFLHSVGGQSRSGLGAVRLSDGAPLPFDARVGMPTGSPTIHKLAVSGTNLFVRGRFEYIGGGTTADFAVLNTATGADTGWETESLGSIAAFAVTETTLYVSGAFTAVNGQPRQNLAAFNLATRQLLPWRPRVSPANGVSQMWIGDDTVYLAGTFTSVNGVPRANLAAVDAVTGEVAPWSLSANGALSAAVAGNAVYVAGNFQALHGQARPGFGSVDALQGTVRAWNPGAPQTRTWSAASAASIVLAPGAVVVAGSFDALVAGFSGTRFFPLTNRAPVLTLAGLTNQQVIRLPANLPLETSASDPDGSVAAVAFHVNRSLWLLQTNPPFHASWSPPVIGDYLVSAVAYDNVGEPSRSSSARIVVLPPLGDVPPMLHIAFPSPGAIVAAFTNLTVLAEAQDADSLLARVEFFRGTNLFFTDTTSPYTATLTNLAPGDYTVDARAVDEFGVAVTNGPVSFHVNFPPSVTLQAPTNNARFPLGANVTLSAAASDSDGSIRSVTFFLNSVPVATASNAPFQFAVSNLAVGQYTLQAAATDNFGATTTSAVAQASVYWPPPNDHFAQRIPLPFAVSRAVGTNTEASAEPNEPRHLPGLNPRKSLWWTWTAPFSARTFVSTEGSDFDTILAVYVGSSLTSLTKLAVNNDEFPQRVSTRLEFQACAGTNYQFVVDGMSGQSGRVVLTVGPVVTLRATNDFSTGFPIHVSGATNVTYQLQRSANWIEWYPVRTILPLSTPFVLVEPESPGQTQEFYRILVEP